MTNLTTCKRCGAQNLAWVQSKRTGRYYLAQTQQYHGMPLGGNGGYSRGGTNVLAHRPHKCDEARPVCDDCGYRHTYGFSSQDHEWRMNGGRVVEDGFEILYRGEDPKIAHEGGELPRKLAEELGE